MFKTPKIKLTLAIFFTQAILLALPMTGCAPAKYDIETEANPEEAGEVTGAGTYEESEEITLKAEPEEGYKFDYWELEGEEVSNNESYVLVVENNASLTAHFSEDNSEDKLTSLLDKAEEAIINKNWKESGTRLKEAWELPGAEEEPFRKSHDTHITTEQDFLSMLLDGIVVTGEEISEDLEVIDELAPQEPEIGVLDKNPEELYEWFAALREWRVNLQTVPNRLYREKLIPENSIQQIHSRSEQYLETPVEMLLRKWEINETGLYIYPFHGIEVLLTDRQFFDNETQLIDADYVEGKVFITLEIKETIETNRSGETKIEPGERWQLIYDIHKKDDGTFRVGDYAIKDLQKDEIVVRNEISWLDTLSP